MKKLMVALFLILLFSIHAQANDPYGDGYDDAYEGQGEWSDNDDYLDGYEDAQRQKEIERIGRERQERNNNWLSD